MATTPTPTPQTAPPPDSSQVQTTPSQVSATVPQQPVQSAPPPPPVNPNVVHDTLFGKAAKFLLGNTTSYSIDPKTGQTVTNSPPQQPGSLMRSILAGALLGGAAAQESHNQNPQMGGLGGAAVGGATGVQDQRRQDQLKLAQAQQQFQNQQAAEKEQREATESDTHQQLFKAQIAESNLQQLRLNQAMQGTSFDQHQAIATAGQAQIKPYLDAGIHPTVENLPESQMSQYFHDHPGANSLDWEHTGVKTIKGPDGTSHFESTLTAFDPTGKVTIPKATFDQWKSDGVFKRFPEYESALQPGKTLTAQQYVAVKRDADTVRADTLGRQAQDRTSAEAVARIRHENAETAHALAETMHAKQQMADESLGKTQAQQFGNALAELDKVGGDFTKLKPSARVLIGESMTKMVPALTAELKAVQSNPEDPDAQSKANTIMGQIDSLTRLGTAAVQGMSPHPAQGSGQISVTLNGKTGVFASQKDADAFVTSHPGAQIVGGPAPQKMVTVRGAGATQQVPQDQLSDFLAKNPEFKEETATPATPAAQPNNYTGR